MSQPFRHEEAVIKQLRTMGMSHFDLRIVNPRGQVVEQRDELFLNQVKDILEWLNDKNEKGNTIEVRPSGEHGHSLITGLTHEQVQNAKLTGCEPALVVGYAADKFQIWLKHDRKLEADAATLASEYLCRKLGGDCEHSKWNSYGYLAGFMVKADGTPYRVELVAHSGEEFTNARALNDSLAQP